MRVWTSALESQQTVNDHWDPAKKTTDDSQGYRQTLNHEIVPFWWEHEQLCHPVLNLSAQSYKILVLELSRHLEVICSHQSRCEAPC